MNPGQRVRLKSDPGRVGSLTGKSRERAGTIWWQIGFSDGVSYQPEYEIELIADDNSDPYTLLAEGRFGRVTDLRRNLSHIQLSGRLANMVYSMDTTNTDFYAYQYKPVLSFLDSPSNGLLIADEVGLGKTIEAGLIWTELRSRYDARRLVVLCPAMLREKWQSELWDRFGVEATIMDAEEVLLELRKNRNEIPDGKAIICSLQGIRPPKNWEDEEEGGRNPRRDLAMFLQDQSEIDPIIDLVIIDEAHYLRNPESQTARLGQLLRAVTEHIVLLSATPINLRDDDLYHLLNLVDPDTFDVKEVFPQVLKANEPLIKARQAALNMQAKEDDIKTHLNHAVTHHLLANNLQLAELLKTSFSAEMLASRAKRVSLANRIERINLLRHAVSRTRKVEVTEWRVVRLPYSEFVDLSEVESHFYHTVTQQIRSYAQRADISEGFLLASPQRQVSSCMYAAAKAWTEKMDNWSELVYEDLGVDTDNSKVFAPLIAHLTKNVLPDVDLEALRRHDTKYERFRAVIQNYLNKHPGEKIVVFSFFRGTLAYLYDRLAEDGTKAQVLVGGIRETKQQVIDRFRDDSTIKVLLSSEVASEGVDLQFSSVLVNYDLPWNPMRVEQRIGRIDRIGQGSPTISIWNLGYKDTIDERIYVRLFERLKIFERALGSMEAILGEIITELTTDLLRKDLTPDQETARIDQTALAIEKIRQDQDELERQASNLIAHGGFILEAVKAAHDFKKRITEQDLVIYVSDYLFKYCHGFQFQQVATDQLLFEIQLPRTTAAEFDEFIRRRRLFGQTRLTSGETIRCHFVNKIAKGRPKVEQISQFHPLIRFISQDLQDRNEAFYPLVAVSLQRHYASEMPVGQYAFAVNRWSFDGLRVEEELRSRVCRLGGKQIMDSDQSWTLVNTVRVEGNDWLSVNNEANMNSLEETLENCLTCLEKDYLQVKHEREMENQDRVNFQVLSATRHRDRQLRTTREVLAKYRESGRTKMIAPLEGRIKKLEERFAVQVERLQRKAQLSSSQTEVCLGVIAVI
ncbi:MAG: SNF2-related protein [Desulfuromonadaceae bacterium]|nr:SNF2-related protein [Desulfuromonadaceae bacterium]